MYHQEKTPKNLKYNNKVLKNKIKHYKCRKKQPSKMTKYPQRVIMKLYHQNAFPNEQEYS
jgi:hypothetical protein